MPRKLQVEGLEAELAAITTLLEEAENIGDPVGTLQYRQKRQEIEEELKTLRHETRPTASVAVLFGGTPVFGSRGIAAEFAGKALEKYQELLSRTYAKAELGLLGTRGPVPLKSRTQMMVTGMARGSLGFVLDELSDQTEIHETALKQMIDEVGNLIEGAASPNEPDFEKIAETLDACALVALKDFFQELDASGATLRVVEDERDFSLDSVAIHRARLRTESTSIDEVDDDLEGKLLGFLPEHRRFELRTPQGELVYGGAAKEAAQQYVHLVQSQAAAIGQTVRVKVRIRTVQPLNRPARKVYQLLEFMGVPADDV